MNGKLKDWCETDVAIFRSTWEYAERGSTFLKCLYQ